MIRRARAAFIFVTTVTTAGIVVTGAEPSHATMATYDSGFHLIVVPAGVTQMTFDLYGAQGSGGNAASTGGLGGRAMATIDVTPGATLQLNVGGAGDNGVHPGYNGGGAHSLLTGGGNGGGATELRLSDGTTKVLVAGGGGGGGADSLGVVGGNGGPGGAATTVAGMGADGTPHGGANGGGGGGGGTDVAGGMGGGGGTGSFTGSNGADGSAGQGGQGGDGFNFGGGGGGGGLFGGGGGGGGGAGATGNAPGGGGGGGSSFGPVGTTFQTGVRSADGTAVVSYATGSTTTTSTMAGASTTSTTVPGGSGLTRSFAVRVNTCVAGATPQLCTPIPTVPLPTDGVLHVQFDASASHCADVIAHLLVDGVERFVSGALAPGGSTGVQDFGPVAAGVHAVGVQAEGVVGGCNAGSIGSWSGTLTLTVTGITEASGALAAPGDAVSVSTMVGGSPAPAAIDASYTRPPGAHGLATLVAATYTPPDPVAPPDPVIPPNPVIGSVAFVDLLLLGAEGGDQVQARFSPGDPVIPPDPILYFFDGAAWSPVFGSDGAPPPYVSGTGFSVSFTDTSTPKVTALGGTVFAFVATPASGCAATPVGATFASLACRLAALTAETQAESALGKLGKKLLVPLGKATTSTTAATAQCASGKTKQPKARLKQVVRQLIQYSHRLRSHSAQKKVPEAVREPLAQTADGIGADANKRRSALRCPDDAAGA